MLQLLLSWLKSKVTPLVREPLVQSEVLLPIAQTITLRRKKSANGWTQGVLNIAGREYFTCEDVIRAPGEKVYGETAIPAGRYEVVITYSPRFKKPLPRLLNVPMFEGVLIHSGNYAKDTEGCILPGKTLLPNGVGNSKAAMDEIMPILSAMLAAGKVFIDVSNS